MTILSEKERKSQMADMKSFDEPMPSVGIFWYDPQEKCFFGVHKKEITPREVEEAAEKGVPFINYPRLHRRSISKPKPNISKRSLPGITLKFLADEWPGISTSSLSWSATGPNPSWMNSPTCLRRSSHFLISNSSMTSIGIWATVGPEIWLQADKYDKRYGTIQK